MKNIFSHFKFLLSKINVYFRYKKKSIILGIKWILFGKEISNFTYEIINEDELLHVAQNITSLNYSFLKKILDEINFTDDNFKKIFTENYYKEFLKKKIFGRRLLWYILVRTLKPDIVIESGVDKKLGSALLVHGLYKNYLENHKQNEFIGLDIENKKISYLNLKNKNSANYKFYYQNTLDFLRKYKSKKKTIYISDAYHNYDFEMKEYNLIKNNLAPGSIIISDNNSGSLSDFSIKHNKKLIYFHENVKNFWHKGGVTSVSFFY